MTRLESDPSGSPGIPSAGSFRWNIFRSPLADYCNELSDPAAAYPRPVLKRIRQDGFNAIWLRVVLREMVATPVFPGLRPREGALDALREIVRRCAEAGLGVFVYLNEPLGFPDDHAFWQSFPHLRGHLDRSFDDGWDRAHALCTSQPETLRFLEEAGRALFSEVPGLSGAVCITASEHLTHCYSHESRYRQRAAALEDGEPYPLTCPRCALRRPAEIVGEVLTALEKGIHAAKPDASILAWNWSWSYYEDAPQKVLLEALPETISVMVDFERGGHQVLPLANRTVEIGVDEYSLGYAGPSERFSAVASEADRLGHPILAKLQIGTTHEISTVPNLPLIPHLIRKVRHLERIHAQGTVATWCLGTFPSVNTYAVGWTLDHPDLGEWDTLAGIAHDYFPGCAVDGVVQGWMGFAHAFRHFPQIQDFLYIGPVNAALAYPWQMGKPDLPMRPTWFPPEPFGTCIEESGGKVLTLPELVETFDRLIGEWRTSLALYTASLAGCRKEEARLEAGVATVIVCQLTSARNLMAFRIAGQQNDWPKIAHLAAAERAVLREALPLVEADPRLGFHQGCFPKPQRFYDPASIQQKIDALAEFLVPA